MVSLRDGMSVRTPTLSVTTTPGVCHHNDGQDPKKDPSPILTLSLRTETAHVLEYRLCIALNLSGCGRIASRVHRSWQTLQPLLIPLSRAPKPSPAPQGLCPSSKCSISIRAADIRNKFASLPIPRGTAPDLTSGLPGLPAPRTAPLPARVTTLLALQKSPPAACRSSTRSRTQRQQELLCAAPPNRLLSCQPTACGRGLWHAPAAALQEGSPALARKTCGYEPLVRMRSVVVKLMGRHPEDLPVGYENLLRDLARIGGYCLVHVSVRRGCIELTLELEQADPAAAALAHPPAAFLDPPPGGSSSIGGGGGSGGAGPSNVGPGGARLGANSMAIAALGDGSLDPSVGSHDAKVGLPGMATAAAGLGAAASSQLGEDTASSAATTATLTGIASCGQLAAAAGTGTTSMNPVDLGSQEAADAMAQLLFASVSGSATGSSRGTRTSFSFDVSPAAAALGDDTPTAAAAAPRASTSRDTANEATTVGHGFGSPALIPVAGSFSSPAFAVSSGSSGSFSISASAPLGASFSSPAFVPAGGSFSSPGSAPLPVPLHALAPGLASVAMGSSSHVPTPWGPTISSVRPRVLALPAAQSASAGWAAPPAGPPAVVAGGSISGGGDGSPLGHRPAGLPGAGDEPAAFVLEVEVNAPHGETWQDDLLAGLYTGGGAAAATAQLGSAARVAEPAGAPAPLELLIRCGGRYVPTIITPVPTTGSTSTSTSAPAAASASPGSGQLWSGITSDTEAFAGESSEAAMADVGSWQGADGSAPVRPSVPLSLPQPQPASGSFRCRVRLLEPPPPGCGVLLVDLRWRGRPAQMVPVLLLEDGYVVSELGAVAATWTGPPRELDGLLYDMGAWLRCTAARRATAAAAIAAAAAAANAIAGGGGGEGGVMAAAAAAVMATPPPAPRPEPAYLPVLGASLLQFAHAQGLLRVAAMLQGDMGGCGYTAPFRPLLGARRAATAAAAAAVAAAVAASAQHAPTPSTTQLATPSPPTRASEPQLPPPQQRQSHSGSATAESPAATQPPPVNPAGETSAADTTANAAARLSSGSRRCSLDGGFGRGAASPAAPGHGQARVSDECSGGGAASTLCDATAALKPSGALSGAEVGAPLGSAVAARGIMGGLRPHDAVASVMGLLRDPSSYDLDCSYREFVESYTITVSCLFQMVDLLSLLELLLRGLLAVGEPAIALHSGVSSSSSSATIGSNPALGAGQADPLVRPQQLLQQQLVLLALTSVPAAVSTVAWLLLPRREWVRVAQRVKLLRHVSLALSRLVATMLGGQGSRLGPETLVMEGVVMPATCLLSPLAALLFAAVKLVLYVAVSHWSMAGGTGGGSLGCGRLAEDVFRALAVTVTGVLTTLACHVHLRLRYRRQLTASARRKAA